MIAATTYLVLITACTRLDRARELRQAHMGATPGMRDARMPPVEWEEGERQEEDEERERLK